MLHARKPNLNESPRSVIIPSVHKKIMLISDPALHPLPVSRGNNVVFLPKFHHGVSAVGFPTDYAILHRHQNTILRPLGPQQPAYGVAPTVYSEGARSPFKDLWLETARRQFLAYCFGSFIIVVGAHKYVVGIRPKMPFSTTV